MSQTVTKDSSNAVPRDLGYGLGALAGFKAAAVLIGGPGAAMSFSMQDAVVLGAGVVAQGIMMWLEATSVSFGMKSTGKPNDPSVTPYDEMTRKLMVAVWVPGLIAGLALAMGDTRIVMGQADQSTYLALAATAVGAYLLGQPLACLLGDKDLAKCPGADTTTKKA